MHVAHLFITHTQNRMIRSSIIKTDFTLEISNQHKNEERYFNGQVTKFYSTTSIPDKFLVICFPRTFFEHSISDEDPDSMAI